MSINIITRISSNMKLNPLVLISLALLVLVSPSFAWKEKIHVKLLQKMEAKPDGSWDIIIDFPKLPDYATDGLTPLGIRTKLMEHADKTQAEVRKKLANFHTLWILNALSTTNANKALIESLAQDHSIVERIVEDELVPFLEPEPERKSSEPRYVPEPEGRQAEEFDLDSRAFGVKMIGALEWWKAGYNGTGVIVGHVDAGADGNHSSLRDSFIGEGGWLNTMDNSSYFPVDDYFRSHGTSTLSVAVGKKVGVAPGAEWVSCSFCAKGTCATNDESYTLACMHFMLCPNPKDNCSFRPHVVNLSWGSTNNYLNYYDEILRMWGKAGIIAVKSSGNYGERGCDTILVPGNNQDVITVGGVVHTEVLLYPSSIGPPLTRYNESEIISKRIFKPDLVAPGLDIISAKINERYEYTDGTSVAAPFVTGAIALILSHPKGKGLNLQGIKEILYTNAFKGVTISRERKCGDFDDSVVPNHKFGYGRLQLPLPNSSWYLKSGGKRGYAKYPCTLLMIISTTGFLQGISKLWGI